MQTSLESKTSIILQERVVSEAGSTKLDFEDCDLVFNKLEPYLGKIVINDKTKEYIGTTEWVPLKLNKKRTDLLFFKYLLLLDEYLKSFWLLRSGKRHARIALVDFRNMLVPEIQAEKQKQLKSSISRLEKRMLSLHSSMLNPLDIIEKVFSKEFGYDIIEYQKGAKKKQYFRNFKDFQKDFLIRSTVKFQHTRYEYPEKILSKHKCLKLKKLCSEKIRRGVQPKYDKDGDILVVKTLNLKHGQLDFTEAKFVSQEFFEANLRAEVLKNDILLSSTGEGRGKVDIYDLDETAIADSHITIIRLKKGISPYYVLYFMRSLLGKAQLETIEMAIKGTPEIYSDQLGEFRVIDIGKKETKLVNEIHKEIKTLQKQEKEIKKLRHQIDQIYKKEIK